MGINLNTGGEGQPYNWLKEMIPPGCLFFLGVLVGWGVAWVCLPPCPTKAVPDCVSASSPVYVYRFPEEVSEESTRAWGILLEQVEQ